MRTNSYKFIHWQQGQRANLEMHLISSEPLNTAVYMWRWNFNKLIDFLCNDYYTSVLLTADKKIPWAAFIFWPFGCIAEMKNVKSQSNIAQIKKRKSSFYCLSIISAKNIVKPNLNQYHIMKKKIGSNSISTYFHSKLFDIFVSVKFLSFLKPKNNIDVSTDRFDLLTLCLIFQPFDIIDI